MESTSTKTELREAAKRLLWADGYAAMSPRQILAESGAGHGSLYHHYTGKEALAADALAEVEAELCAWGSGLLDSDAPPLDRIRAFLLVERDGLRGCRLGRLASESDVIASDALRGPIARYLAHAERLLARAFEEAIATRMLPGTLDPSALAAAAVAVVQGGYVTSRAARDVAAIRHATCGFWAMIEALRSGEGI